MENFRCLKAEDIECSVLTCTEQGIELLLSKNADCDMRILDETVGPQCWQRKHEMVGDYLFCSVGIRVDGEWIWKQDTGAENIKAEDTAIRKNAKACGSFRRACAVLIVRATALSQPTCCHMHGPVHWTRQPT